MHLHKSARFLQHLHLSSDTTAGEPRFSSSSKCLIKNKKLSLNSAASVFVKLCFCVFTKGRNHNSKQHQDTFGLVVH